MASLMDIAAVGRQADVSGGKVDVRGVSAKGLASLMGRFPMLRDAILGKGLDLSPESLMETGPDTVAAIIAAGCGFPGDDKAEARAAEYPVGDQLELIATILEATLPGGTKKVADRLGAAANVVGLSLTPSPPPSDT